MKNTKFISWALGVKTKYLAANHMLVQLSTVVDGNGEVNISQSELAAMTGCSRKTVILASKYLVHIGRIEMRQGKKTDGTNQFAANTYRLILPTENGDPTNVR